MQYPSSNLVSVHCAQCVVEFGITRELYNRRQSDHAGFTCPNGHSNVFKKPGEDDEDDDEEEEEETPPEDTPPQDDGKVKFDPITIH